MVKEDSLWSDKAFADLLPVARDGSLKAEETKNARGRHLEPHRQDLLSLADCRLPKESRALRDEEDIVQAAFLKAHRNLCNFEGETRQVFAAWLSSILINIIKDFIAACDRRKRALGGERSLDDPEGWLAFYVAGSSWPGSDLDRQETLQRVNCVLADLSERHRCVLELCYHQGLSYVQAGSQLGLSAGAVRQQCLRALQEVRRRLRQADTAPD